VTCPPRTSVPGATVASATLGVFVVTVDRSTEPKPKDTSSGSG